MASSHILRVFVFVLFLGARFCFYVGQIPYRACFVAIVLYHYSIEIRVTNSEVAIFVYMVIVAYYYL